MVVLHPENVVGGFASDPRNVVDLSKNMVQNVVEINQEQSPYPSENVVVGAQKTQWTAVWAAHTLVGKMSLSCVLARLYNEARTYFQSQA